MPQKALALVVMAALAVAAVVWWRWPASDAALGCPGGAVHLDADGVARCGEGTKLPAAQALTVGQALDLNAVTADELALLSGIGPSLAAAIVAERGRLGRFADWEQVGAVAGVGPARLATLQAACVLGPP